MSPSPKPTASLPNPRALFTSPPARATAGKVLGFMMLAGVQADAEQLKEGEQRFLGVLDEMPPSLLACLMADLSRAFVLGEREPTPEDICIFFLARFSALSMGNEWPLPNHAKKHVLDPEALPHWLAIKDSRKPVEPYSKWLFEDAALAVNSHHLIRRIAAEPPDRRVRPAGFPDFKTEELDRMVKVFRVASPDYFRIAKRFLPGSRN